MTLEVLFERTIDGAVCVGVALPDLVAPGAGRLTLHDERACNGYGEARRRTWMGGRAALREALARAGAPSDGPLPATRRGAPALPPGWVGSVSHKNRVAVAIVSPDRGEQLGVDIEELGPPRLHLATRLLTPAEQNELHALPEEARWFELLLRFSAKEALYKAIDPYVQRYVGFGEVAITRGAGNTLGVSQLAAADLQALEAHGTWERIEDHLLTTFRARPR